MFLQSPYPFVMICSYLPSKEFIDTCILEDDGIVFVDFMNNFSHFPETVKAIIPEDKNLNFDNEALLISSDSQIESKFRFLIETTRPFRLFIPSIMKLSLCCSKKVDISNKDYTIRDIFDFQKFLNLSKSHLGQWISMIETMSQSSLFARYIEDLFDALNEGLKGPKKPEFQAYTKTLMKATETHFESANSSYFCNFSTKYKEDFFLNQEMLETETFFRSLETEINDFSELIDRGSNINISIHTVNETLRDSSSGSFDEIREFSKPSNQPAVGTNYYRNFKEELILSREELELLEAEEEVKTFCKEF